MKNKTLALLVAATFAAPTLASAKDFTGFGVGAELQVKSTEFDYTETETSVPYSSGDNYGGKSDVIGALNLWYGFNLTPSWVLQVGATADLGKTESYSSGWSDPGGWGEFKIEERNHYSLYLAPGYRVTPKTLMYGKIGYHQMKGKAEYNDWTGYSSQWFDKKFSGLGLGVGVSTMFTNNLYGYVEAQHVMYGDKTVWSIGTYTEKMEPTSTIGSIGLGWNF